MPLIAGLDLKGIKKHPSVSNIKLFWFLNISNFFT